MRTTIMMMLLIPPIASAEEAACSKIEFNMMFYNLMMNNRNLWFYNLTWSTQLDDGRIEDAVDKLSAVAGAEVLG